MCMSDKQLLAQRLNAAYDLLRTQGVLHTISEFANILKKPQPHVSLALKGDEKRCTLGLLTRVADTFPDILSRDYLLTGQGDVAAPDRSMRPHFEATARAGFMIGLSEAETDAPLHTRNPDMPDYDFTIRAQGDSMLPKIESGDILYCRHATDRQNPPIGKVCVLDTKEGPVVKVIARADDERVLLHSYNPEHKDYDIAVDLINGVASVVGLSRVFDNNL